MDSWLVVGAATMASSGATPAARSVKDWAVAEALRLYPKKAKEVAAAAAARRAPGLMAAAEALDRLAGRADDFLLEAIPQPVRDYLDAAGAPMEEGEVGSVDDATIDRVEKWLRRSPYELKKVSSPLAAIAAAAPVALFQVQNTAEASDPDLVKACLEALENKKKADKKPVSVTSTHKRPRAYAPLTKRARKY